MEDDLVSILLEDISDLLKLESSMPSGLADLLKSLDQDLMFINQSLIYLKREDGKLKDVLCSIQDVILEAEDVIDTFAVETAKKKRRSTFDKIRHAVVEGNIFQVKSKQVKSIRNQILAISSETRKLEVRYSEPADNNLPTRRKLHAADMMINLPDNVVGLDEDVNNVMEMLCGSNPGLDVISIVGMGGVGKTTLAKKVYNHDLVKQQFDRHAWVVVSSNYETEDLLISILRCFGESVERMGENQLVLEVRKRLEGKKYLIVLDDVWSTEAWVEIRDSFPDNKNGSRILITSRRQDVARHESTSPPYLLSGLSQDDSRELFKRIVFYQDDYCPPELEKIGRQIVDNCNGFPLALKVLGRELARRERTVRGWSQVAWPDDSNTVLYKKLTPTYNNLPPRLKHCFLYFGGFAEDSTFTARQLIRLWIAEGFVAKNDNRKLEDIAEEYLKELLSRNMIQDARRRSDGGVKSFVMHDLMRDLSLCEGKKENFFVVHTGNESIDLSTAKLIRRLSIQYITWYLPLPLTLKYASRARTLLSLADPDEMSIQMLKSICNGFPLLRVLDLGSTVVDDIPSEVENLIHLKYLRMNAPKVSEIPTSISNIPMLQTLDLRESRIKYLTNNFWDMQELRHLFLSGSDCELRVIHQNEVKTMSNLQTLSTISSSTLYLLDWDAVFPNLRKLGLQSPKFHTPWQLANPKFHRVQTLKIISTYFHDDRLLSSLGSSSRLTKLTLRDTYISLRVLEMVAKLPNLEILKLMNKSVAEVSIECRQGWFPKLQVLHMVDLDLKKWTFEQITPPEIEELEQKIMTLKSKSPLLRIIQRKNGWVQPDSRFENNRLEWEIKLYLENNPKVDVEALQSLRNLSITKCRDLVEIPEELKKVTTLRNVKASFCNSILERKLRELGDNVHYEFQNY